tara:strand:+ start:190 stop:1788 length:1599 start_codon:yes stop_codon:yes gene_type:complete
VSALDFKDDKFKINLKYNEKVWTQVAPKKFRERLVLRHLNMPATVNVLAYRFNETITANGLVKKRIQSVYDGWQLLSQQDISELQVKQKNILEGIRSIYRKSYLDDNLSEQYMLTGDICFVADDTLGIILNISVDQPDTLLDVKTEFNKIYNSLWFGDDKPNVSFVINNHQEWIMNNQNLSRMRQIKTKVSLNETVKVIKQLNLPKIYQSNNIKLYTNSNGDYILSGDELIYIDPVSFTANTIRLNMNDPEIMLSQDGFYAIQKYPRINIVKYSNKLINGYQYESNNYAINVFPLNDQLFIISPQDIRLMNQNDIVWLISHNFDIHDVVSTKDQLIIADNNNATIHFIDLNKGRVLKSIEIKPGTNQRFKDIAIKKSQLYVVTADGDQITHTHINLESQNIDDQLSQNYRDISIVSVTNEFIIFSHINNDGKKILEALDAITFATVWTIPYDNNKHTMITSTQVFSIDDKQNKLILFDLKSGKEIKIASLKEQLVNDSDPNASVKVLAVLPQKNKLLTIIEQNSETKAVYLR